MARCLRDSIQLATAAFVKEQQSIVYLINVCISRHDGERIMTTIDIYEYSGTPNPDTIVTSNFLLINRVSSF